MMAAFFASDPISVVLRSRENPLPWPITTSIGILAFQCMRQTYTPKSLLDVFLVLGSVRLNMFKKHLLDPCWQHRVTVFITFAGSNDNLITGEINILDPKATAFH